jgi:mevalonate kinase
MIGKQGARAPGKLLLFGEHAAVYGHPAVGIALDRYLSVSYAPGNHWSVTLTTAGKAPVTEPFPDADRFFLHLSRTISNFQGSGAHGSSGRPDPGRIEVWSDLPIGSGFGSSAALCVALAQLFRPEENNPVTRWKIAHELERFFHGTPSGIDTGLSALGGAQSFSFIRREELPETRECRLPAMHLVAGSIPRSSDTRTLVAGIRRRMEKSPEETTRSLEQLGELARGVIVTDGGVPVDLAFFASSATAAQKILRGLDLSTPVLDNLLYCGCRAGALGGKLSGAGGGGAFFLVCETENAAENVIAAIREALRRESVTATTLFSMAV